MKVRYIGDGQDLERGHAYEVLGVTDNGLLGIESGGPVNLLLPASDFKLTRYINPGAGKFDVFYTECRGRVIEEDENGVLKVGEAFYSNLASPDGYMPEVTFVPQCSQCKLVRKCTKGMFRLFRRNYIKCADRISDERLWEPNASFLYMIEEEFKTNSHLYTEIELIEARETIARLLNEERSLGERLTAIERRFHDVINERCHFLKWAKNPDREMPRIEVDLFVQGAHEWFPVPGMYGGFAYSLDLVNGELALTVESWCRVVEGSGQRHLITPERTELVKEGFV